MKRLFIHTNLYSNQELKSTIPGPVILQTKWPIFLEGGSSGAGGWVTYGCEGRKIVLVSFFFIFFLGARDTFHLEKVRTHAAYNGRKFVYTGILTMAREFDKLSVDAIVFFSQCITRQKQCLNFHRGKTVIEIKYSNLALVPEKSQSHREILLKSQVEPPIRVFQRTRIYRAHVMHTPRVS